MILIFSCNHFLKIYTKLMTVGVYFNVGNVTKFELLIKIWIDRILRTL